MTELVRDKDMDWASFRELLVLSYGNLQSICPLMHYSFMGATKARTFKIYGTRRQLDPPRVELLARLRTAQQTLHPCLQPVFC